MSQPEGKLDVVKEDTPIDAYNDEKDIMDDMPPLSEFKDTFGKSIKGEEKSSETEKPSEEDTKDKDADKEAEKPEDKPTEEAESKKEESSPSEDDKPKEDESKESGDKKKDDKEEELIHEDDPKGVQKRINKAVKQHRAEERKRKQAESKVEELQNRIKELEAQPEKQADSAEGDKAQTKLSGDVPAPNPDDYDDYDAYQKDRDKWLIDTTIKATTKTVREEIAAENEKRQKTEHQKAIDAKLKPGRDKYKDFDEVVFGAGEDTLINEIMGDAALDSEYAAEILYYLGSHADEADRISRLTPFGIMRELGKIELKVANTASGKDDSSSNKTESESKKKPTTRPSSTYTPSKPAGGTAPPTVELEKISMKDFEKKFNKEYMPDD